METATPHPPVILLLGKRTSSNDCFDEWLAASRYSTCEAADVFQALEQISDFTQGARPDVVFLHLDSDTSELEFMHTLVATASDDPSIPVIDLMTEGPTQQTTEDLEAAIAGLASQLDKFIPRHSSARA